MSTHRQAAAGWGPDGEGNRDGAAGKSAHVAIIAHLMYCRWCERRISPSDVAGQDFAASIYFCERCAVELDSRRGTGEAA